MSLSPIEDSEETVRRAFFDSSKSMARRAGVSINPQDPRAIKYCGSKIFSDPRMVPRGVELIVSILPTENPEDTLSLPEYASWFKDWEIYNMGNHAPPPKLDRMAQRIPQETLEEMKRSIIFLKAQRQELGGLVTLNYFLREQLIRKMEGNIEEVKTSQNYMRTMIFNPLFSWLSYHFPQRIPRKKSEKNV